MHQQHPQMRTANCAVDARRKRVWFRGVQGLVVLTAICCCGSEALAFRVIDATDFGLGIGRWNAAPHFVDGVERSLDGGLRYSLQGGSYEAFRDQFQWDVVPSVAEFQAAVQQAFADWEAVDPFTGLGTELYFVPDFDTPIVIEPVPPTLEGRFQLNRGAEIDLTAAALAPFSGLGTIFGDPNASSVTLTSGVTNYPAGVISGADIKMSNSTPWTDVNRFQKLLSHEIGHAFGLGDIDAHSLFGPFEVQSLFYDDNYDDTSDATALATLTNSFADLIDPFDPDNSPALMLYEPCTNSSCDSRPGFDTPGVNINMESSPTGKEPRIGPQNDDFAGRQFLYPYVALAGNFNNDDVVDGADFLAWQRGESPDPLSATDLAEWQANFGAANSLAAGQSVPEPATAMLVCVMVTALLVCRIRWSRSW